MAVGSAPHWSEQERSITMRTLGDLVLSNQKDSETSAEMLLPGAAH